MPEPTDRHADSYYAATATPHPDREPLLGEVQADACVVGGGFTGLAAALELAERGYAVVLLEAARVGWGASGRNGGQIGSGMRKDAVELEPAVGREAAAAMWELAEEAKAIIDQRVERHGIECDLRRGNLLAATRRRFLPDLAAEAEHVARRYGYDGYRMVSQAEIREMVATTTYVGGRLDAGGGHLHPLNYALGLAAAAEAAGVAVHEGSAVLGIDRGEPARVRTATGSVRARQVLLCTNAHLGRLEPRIAARMMPIGNHMLATEPLGEARARALIRDDCCVHATKFVVDYYRLSADHRLLFGGGETYTEAGPGDIKSFVRRHMLRVFPQLADARIEYGWSGQVGITVSRMPDFGRLGPNGFYVQGFSGHGVAMSQIAGRLLAEVAAGTAERFDLMAGLRHRAFPGGPLMRKPTLVAGMLYYSLRDRF